MTTINLMPWREDARVTRQQTFLVIGGGVLGLTLGIAVLTHLGFSHMLNRQNDLNHLLKQEIVVYDQRIAEIKSLHAIREGLIARMAIIQRLQTDRPQIVHLMDELVAHIPAGIFVVKMTREGNQITLNGFAESNTNISDFMRAIDRSTWLSQSDLKEIKQAHQDSQDMSGFTLTMVLNNQPRQFLQKRG